MGLFDFSLDNLDDPKNQALVATGLSLLSPKSVKTSLLGNIGESGMTGLQTLVNAKQQERTNRQSDLQQLQGAYTLLKSQEFGRMLQAQQSGQPYTPNPLLGQVENRLSQLVTGPNLSKLIGNAPASPSVPPAPQAVPGVASPSASPMANPDYQPVPGAVRANSATPVPTSTPQAPGSPGGLGGPAGGIPMQWWLAQDPTGASYMKQLAEDNKPITLRQGDLVGRKPDGTYGSLYQQPPTVPGVLPNRDANGQVQSFRQAPGFADAAAAIKGAEMGATEGARAPYTFQNVTTASGASVPMSIAQLMGNKSPTVSGLPFVSQPPQAAKVTVTQPSKQAQAVPTDPTDPWSTIPKVAVPQGLGQTTSQKVLDQKRGDLIGTLSDKFNADADAAAARIALNTQAREQVDNADTGWLASHISQFRNVLGSLGVQSAADKGATDQVLAKDLVQTAVTRGKQLFGSRFTQSEVGLMLNKGSASPEMQKAAIKFLIDTDNATQQYNIQRGLDFHKYLSQGGDALAFTPWYSQNFPLTKQLENIAPPGSAGMPKVGEVRQGYVFKGGDPSKPTSWAKQ